MNKDTLSDKVLFLLFNNVHSVTFLCFCLMRKFPLTRNLYNSDISRVSLEFELKRVCCDYDLDNILTNDHIKDYIAKYFRI